MFSYTISEINVQKQYHEISLQYFKENGSYILINQYEIGGFQKLITIAIRGDSMSYSQSPFCCHVPTYFISLQHCATNTGRI